VFTQRNFTAETITEVLWWCTAGSGKQKKVLFSIVHRTESVYPVAVCCVS